MHTRVGPPAAAPGSDPGVVGGRPGLGLPREIEVDHLARVVQHPADLVADLGSRRKERYGGARRRSAAPELRSGTLILSFAAAACDCSAVAGRRSGGQCDRGCPVVAPM